MNVRELIELLSQYEESAEVRMATQPHYPMEFSVGTVVSVEELDGGDPEILGTYAASKLVFLVEGAHIGYGNKRVFEY